MKRIQLSYEVGIEYDGDKGRSSGMWSMYDQLEDAKRDGVLASLVWNNYECNPAQPGICYPGVRIIRIYNVTQATSGKVYRNVVGYCFNGDYYPKSKWTAKKDSWKLSHKVQEA